MTAQIGDKSVFHSEIGIIVHLPTCWCITDELFFRNELQYRLVPREQSQIGNMVDFNTEGDMGIVLSRTL